MIPELVVQRSALQCFDSDPNLRWVFFFAHPDDELAVAAWLKRLVAASVDVTCCWAHATPIREQESRKAVARIAPSVPMRFADFPDGNLVDVLCDLKRWVSDQIAEARPDRVVVTAYEQGHLDHDSLSYAVSQMATCPVLEYPMYHHYGRWIQRISRYADPTGEEILRLTQEETNWKRALLDCYPSQTVRRNIRLAESASKLIGAPSTLLAEERLRIQPTIDPTRTVHSGRDAQMIERTREWRRWLKKTRELVGSK